MKAADLVIIGGGIVSLATGLELRCRQPGARVMMLEKEPAAAPHQTGRNSGVIHAGVYYAPGRLKARFCRDGAGIRAFSDAHGLPYEDCGKLIGATSTGPVSAGKAMCCAGLHADRMAQAMSLDPDFRIVPLRGEYFRIPNQPADLVRRLIYPVPDPERPFLGVHLTRKMGGGFTVGPNVGLAMKREGYARTDLSQRDLAAALGWPGFWRMLARNARPAVGELVASVSTPLYLKKVQRYAPHRTRADLAPCRAGVRAQAVARKGQLVSDFLFLEGHHALHVCNAPSPAATAAVPIARHIADRQQGAE